MIPAVYPLCRRFWASLPNWNAPLDMALPDRLIRPRNLTEHFHPWKKVRPEWLPYTVNSRTDSVQPHGIAGEMLGLKKLLLLAPFLPFPRV